MINGSSCCRWRGATVNAIVLMDRLSTICQTDNPFTLHPLHGTLFQCLFGFRMRSSVRIMWIRHSSASCLCLCSCLVSLVLIAAEIACRQAIRLSLPKPQATPFLPFPLSLSHFEACGRWQRAFLNGALNKLPTATKFANLPCSLRLSLVPFLPLLSLYYFLSQVMCKVRNLCVCVTD